MTKETFDFFCDRAVELGLEPGGASFIGRLQNGIHVSDPYNEYSRLEWEDGRPKVTSLLLDEAVWDEDALRLFDNVLDGSVLSAKISDL